MPFLAIIPAELTSEICPDYNMGLMCEKQRQLNQHQPLSPPNAPNLEVAQTQQTSQSPGVINPPLNG